MPWTTIVGKLRCIVTGVFGSPPFGDTAGYSRPQESVSSWEARNGMEWGQISVGEIEVNTRSEDPKRRQCLAIRQRPNLIHDGPTYMGEIFLAKHRDFDFAGGEPSEPFDDCSDEWWTGSSAAGYWHKVDGLMVTTTRIGKPPIPIRYTKTGAFTFWEGEKESEFRKSGDERV